MTERGIPSKAEILGDLVEADSIRNQYRGVGLKEIIGDEDLTDITIDEPLPEPQEPETQLEPQYEEEVIVNDAEEEVELEYGPSVEEGPSKEEVRGIDAVSRIKNAARRQEYHSGLLSN